MDYKKTIAALAVAATATVATAEIVSSSVVGYQNKALDAKFNYVCNTFVPVGGDRDTMTFGDITPNEDFVYSTIQLLTSGGATAKVTVDGLGTVEAIFTYWTADDGAVAGAGWYLEADDEARYNQNSRVITAGSAFCVNRETDETDATITLPKAL